MIRRLREGGVGAASTDGQLERSIITVRAWNCCVDANRSMRMDAGLLFSTFFCRCVGWSPTGRRAADRSGVQPLLMRPS